VGFVETSGSSRTWSEPGLNLALCPWGSSGSQD